MIIMESRAASSVIDRQWKIWPQGLPKFPAAPWFSGGPQAAATNLDVGPGYTYRNAILYLWLVHYLNKVDPI